MDAEEAHGAALAALPQMTPGRLRRLLTGRSTLEAWSALRDGGLSPGPSGPSRGQGPLFPAGGEEAALYELWARCARRVDPARVMRSYTEAGVRVHLAGRPGFPEPAALAPSPPAILFSMGSLGALDRPRVTLVGTRSATHYGLEVAAELGAGLARAGVSVVSGLAAGIDGAAHQGALVGGNAPPLAVVATGLDVVYPASHARLWARVASEGSLLSESPLGAVAQRWRFPWRNRLLAALGDVVVVVESHVRGGSLLTVEAAARCGRPVLAVPGSVRSPASAGANSLLADGCPPARDVDDVLVALSLEQPGAGLRPAASLPGLRPPQAGWPPSGSPSRPGARPPGPGGKERGPRGRDERSVWAALGTEPTTIDVVVRRTGLGPAQVAAVLGRLEGWGWARPGEGWWARCQPGVHG